MKTIEICLRELSDRVDLKVIKDQQRRFANELFTQGTVMYNWDSDTFELKGEGESGALSLGGWQFRDLLGLQTQAKTEYVIEAAQLGLNVEIINADTSFAGIGHKNAWLSQASTKINEFGQQENREVGSIVFLDNQE